MEGSQKPDSLTPANKPHLWCIPLGRLRNSSWRWPPVLSASLNSLLAIVNARDIFWHPQWRHTPDEFACKLKSGYHFMDQKYAIWREKSVLCINIILKELFLQSEYSFQSFIKIWKKKVQFSQCIFCDRDILCRSSLISQHKTGSYRRCSKLHDMVLYGMVIWYGKVG